MKKKNNKNEPKTTSEKPISLSPLKLKEALEGLLKVEPQEDNISKPDDKPKEK